MSEDRFKQLEARIRALEDINAGVARAFITAPMPAEKKAEPKIDVTGLKWEEVRTENPFETCKNYEAEAYKLLKAKIAEKQGKPIWLDGYTYWIMRDGTTLARRKK